MSALPKKLQNAIRVRKTIADPLNDFVARTCGGRKAVLAILQHATDDPQAQQIAEEWDRLERCDRTNGRKMFSWDQLLELTHLSAREFVGCVTRCAWDLNLDIGKTIVAMRYPEMMHASMERATQVDGTEERRLHLSASGYLPQKAGIQIGINNVNRQDREDGDEPGQAPSFRTTARNVVRDLPPAREAE